MTEINLTKAVITPKISHTIVAGGVLRLLTVTSLSLIVDYGLSLCPESRWPSRVLSAEGPDVPSAT